MQHDRVMKKVKFVIMTPPPGSGGGEGRGLRAKPKLPPCCCIRNYIKFDIQRDYVFEKVEF